MNPPQNGAQRPQCWFCGAASTRRIRLQPKFRGGRATADNLVPACQGCEYAKGIATLAEFREIVRRTLLWSDPHMVPAAGLFKFAGEGGPPVQWPDARREPGRPKKPVDPRDKQGIACTCGRWVPARQLAGHLKICRG